MTTPTSSRKPSPTPQQRDPGWRPGQSAFDDPKFRAYVSEYAARQAENDHRATEASNRWLKRKAWLEAYIKANEFLYQSEKAKRDKVANDWELSDAMDAWKWHGAEAQRCHNAIQTKFRMAELSDRLRGIGRA